METTNAFASLWHEVAGLSDAQLAARFGAFAASTSVVFVRGYLGGFMPGNLREPARAAARCGFDARVAPLSTRGTVDDNVDGLAACVAEQLARSDRERFILCGHSKGGLESLALVQRRPALAARCAGVILSQTPRGSSRVLECLLDSRHDETLCSGGRRISVGVQRRGLRAIGGARGGRELIAPHIGALTRSLLEPKPSVPVLQTASWSSQPTTWLDSFHERLREIRPGCAHDGQFFLEDLIWPGLPHVLVPHLDHAQPVMGGHGFRHDRYWLVMLLMLAEGRGT
ncbi:MAG: hypothetical protein Q8O67_31400 [Deltaproteobacteria bacterium]|nr:hypothetical protein [Deltaproteobacteria bacterium]